MLDWWIGYDLGKPGSFQMGRFILPYSRQFYTHPGQLLFGDLSAADYAFNLQRHRVVLGARPRTHPGPQEPLLQSGR